MASLPAALRTPIAAAILIQIVARDLRKLKGHGLLERDGARYAYRLTSKGVEVALLDHHLHHLESITI